MRDFWKILIIPFFFVLLIWIIEGISVVTGVHFIGLGVIPRTISGIPGIFFSPFIHGSYEHLLSNTLPLLVVGSGLIYFYREIALNVITMIWFFMGFWVWLAARQNSHIGASGLIYGLVCFLFFSGIIRKDTRLLAVSLLVTFLYGSMVWGILPVDQSISWESHLFGSVAGIFCAIYYRHLGPQRPKPQWEIDEENEKIEMEKNKIISESEMENEIPKGIAVNYDFIPKKPEKSNTDKPDEVL